MESSHPPAFDQGVQAWQHGRFFEAHEHWEDVWREATDVAIRRGLQGLVQLAASLHKLEQGSLAGHARLWTKAQINLKLAAHTLPVLHGVDLARLLDQIPEAAPPAESRPSLPPKRPRFGAVYLHGFGSSPNSPKGQAVLHALAQAGVAAVAPRLADPEEFFDFTVSRSIERARHCLFDRTLLVGSSLGGWTGTLLALEEPRIVEMVLLCPAFRFPDRWFSKERAEEVERWQREGQISFEVGHPAELKPLSVNFLYNARQLEGAPQPPVPTTVFHGAEDDVVPLRDVLSVTELSPLTDLKVVDDDHSLRDCLPLIARTVEARARALSR